MSELSPAKQRAAWLIATDELTRTEVAEMVGVHVDTVYAWLRDPAFQAEVRKNCEQLMRELMVPAIARLKREIRKGKSFEALKAIELMFKAAGVVAAAGEASNDGATASGEHPASRDDLEALDPAEAIRKYREALG